MLSCNVVKDLLPGYTDGLTSEETNAEIDAHLETCEDCRAANENMQAPIKVAPEFAKKKNPDGFFDYLKKVKRKTWIISGSIFGVIVLALAAFIFAFAIGVPLSSSEVDYEAYISSEVRSGDFWSDDYAMWQLDYGLKADVDANMAVFTSHKFSKIMITINSDGVSRKEDLTTITISPRKTLSLFGSSTRKSGMGVLLTDIRGNMEVILRLADKDVVFTTDDMRALMNE
ncbi:MAG: zf-HC2 domain-containing protein [Oscillospiraceae bacterium]|jgi:hypothetical protein|nr:zf-HC2 domain-containing protein [Oscillospiraceae bacterium]